MRPLRNLKIVIPPRAGLFSTLRLLAKAAKTKLAALRSADSSNSRFALRQSSLRALKLRGQGTPKNLQCALLGSDSQ
jgi:hypothetical protein